MAPILPVGRGGCPHGQRDKWADEHPELAHRGAWDVKMSAWQGQELPVWWKVVDLDGGSFVLFFSSGFWNTIGGPPGFGCRKRGWPSFLPPSHHVTSSVTSLGVVPRVVRFVPGALRSGAWHHIGEARSVDGGAGRDRMAEAQEHL